MRRLYSPRGELVKAELAVDELPNSVANVVSELATVVCAPFGSVI